MLDNKALPKGLNYDKGVIRFSNLHKLDFKLIRKLLTDAVNSMNVVRRLPEWVPEIN